MTKVYIRSTDGDLSNIELRDYIGHKKRDLRYIDVSSQDLRDYNFTGADLRDANLAYCETAHVTFYDADLRGANLIGCDFTGADLRRVKTDDNTILPYDIVLIGHEQLPHYSWDVVITPHEMRIACQCHPIEEWENATDEWLNEISLLAIPFWKKHGKYLLDVCNLVRSKYDKEHIERNIVDPTERNMKKVIKLLLSERETLTDNSLIKNPNKDEYIHVNSIKELIK